VNSLRGFEDDRGILSALIFSLLLHAVFLLVSSVLHEPKQQPPIEKLIEVSLRPETLRPETPIQAKQPVPIPSTQIISPPDLPENPIPVESRFKSDKNFKTEKQQVKRGDGQAKSLPKTESAPTRKDPVEVQTKVLDPKSIDLKLSETAVRDLAAKPQAPGKLKSLATYRPFTGNQTEDLFRAAPGTPDFLPGIPDGEMTLLNAKADRFAPFVRRVAGQVFGLVRKFQWHSIPGSEVRRIGNFVTIEAVMSPSGKLLSIKLLEASGSPSFDRLISKSVQEGVNDQNPPSGARAEDGNIHFVFQSRCWSRPGGGGNVESRWLLLATGLL